MEVELFERDLATIAKSYGKVYDLGFGDVSYTELEAPDDFILESSREDRLRYYLYRKKEIIKTVDIDKPTKEGQIDLEIRKGVWEFAPGVSTIAKEGLPTSEDLVMWRVNKGAEESQRIVEEAAEVGTNAHKALEELFNGVQISMTGRSKKERWCIVSGANFLTDLKIRAIQTEQIVGYDTTLKVNNREIRVLYAGTTDLICEIWNPKLNKWEIWVIDYKTSKEAFLSHRIQVIGYAEACVSAGKITHYDRAGILLLGKQTKRGYQLVDATDLGRNKWKLSFNDFLNAYYNFLLNNGGKITLPTYKVYPLILSVKKSDEITKEDSEKVEAKKNVPSPKAKKQASTVKAKLHNDKPTHPKKDPEVHKEETN